MLLRSHLQDYEQQVETPRGCCCCCAGLVLTAAVPIPDLTLQGWDQAALLLVWAGPAAAAGGSRPGSRIEAENRRHTMVHVRLSRHFGHPCLAGRCICCPCPDTLCQCHSPPCLHHMTRCWGGAGRLLRAYPCLRELFSTLPLLAGQMSYLLNSILTATSDQ